MRRPLFLLSIALACVLAGGWLYARTENLSYWHGVYCGLGTATTVGCDVTPRGPARVIAALLMLTALPLLGAAFSEMTGHLSASRVRAHLAVHIAGLEQRLREEADSRHEDMKQHVTATVHPLPEPTVRGRRT